MLGHEREYGKFQIYSKSVMDSSKSFPRQQKERSIEIDEVMSEKRGNNEN